MIYPQKGFISNGLSGAESRGPGPLEVEAAEVAGHVHHLADKVESRDGAAPHGLGVELGGVDAAGGDLGLFVSFGALGDDVPGVRAMLQRIEVRVGPARG